MRDGALISPRRALFVAFLLAGLILAHGCHGPDEDHELFVPIVRWGSLTPSACR